MVTMVQGPFLEIAKFGISNEEFYEGFNDPIILEGNIDELERNMHQINKDVSRTPLIDNRKEFNVFSAESKQEKFTKQPYTQGNFMGGLGKVRYQEYGRLKMDSLEKRLQNTVNKKEKEKIQAKIDTANSDFNNQEIMQFFSFAYRNDKGKLCGFSLTFSKKRPKDWIIDITQNTTSTSTEEEEEEEEEKKITTVLTNGELDEILKGQGRKIAPKNLPNSLSLAINSTFVSNLIQGVMNPNGAILLDKFDKLRSRIKANQNIDNRDAKQAQLIELFLEERNKFAPNQNKDLEQDIETIVQKIKTDPDFFIDDNFTKTLNNFPECVKYTQALDDFTVKIDDWGKKPDISPDETYLLSQAELVLNEIESFRAIDTNSQTEENNLPKLTSRLVSFNRAIDEKFPITYDNYTKYDAYTQALDAFNATVEGLPKNETNVVQQSQAELILEDIKNMSTLKPESPNENTARLTELTSKLVSFNRAIKENFPITPENHTKYQAYTQALDAFHATIKGLPEDKTNIVQRSQAKLILEDIEKMKASYHTPTNENTDPLTELTSKLVYCNGAIEKNLPITLGNYTKYHAYNQALAAFDKEINGKQGSSGLQSEIVTYAGSISDEIKALASQHDKEENRLPRLTKMLNACTKALNNPSEDNINQLTACSKEASRKSAPAWKKLGKGLLVFAALTTAVALIVVSALAVVPSGGVSLLGVAAGIALLNSARVIARPAPSDLDNATEKFKDTLNSRRNQNSRNENEVGDESTPPNPAGNP